MCGGSPRAASKNRGNHQRCYCYWRDLVVSLLYGTHTSAPTTRPHRHTLSTNTPALYACFSLSLLLPLTHAALRSMWFTLNQQTIGGYTEPTADSQNIYRKRQGFFFCVSVSWKMYCETNIYETKWRTICARDLLLLCLLVVVVFIRIFVLFCWLLLL